MGGAEQSYSSEAACAMLMFSLASSSLLLINKLCLHHFPVPAFVSALQFLSASITSVVRALSPLIFYSLLVAYLYSSSHSQVLMGTGLVATDHFEWKKVKPYLIYVGMFVATIYTNMRALQHSNVETIIVFRAVSAARLQRIKPHAKLSSRFSLSLSHLRSAARSSFASSIGPTSAASSPRYARCAPCSSSPPAARATF